jgi:peptide-methionine (R)-S-oxide reductase
MKQINPDLTSEQKAILVDKSTEKPFTGRFLALRDTGEYVCANCGQQLFDTSAQYDAGCGWPSFDRALPGSTVETIDRSHDMVRTEVTCSQCEGHLGHVFPDGPKQTTGERYCINSLSLDLRTSSYRYNGEN